VDFKSKAKSKVLDKLIEAMDEKIVGDLKGKSPKFAKVNIESDDPELAGSIKEKVMEGIEDDMPGKEVMGEMGEMGEMDCEGDEDLERLKELYAKLK
jgi:hypothetical protein